MKNDFTSVCVIFAGWLAVCFYLSQFYVIYSAIMAISGFMVLCFVVNNKISALLISFEKRIDLQSKSTPSGIKNAARSLNESINNFQKKISLTIEGIDQLGKQQELKQLQPILLDDALGNALLEASKMITKIKSEEAQRQWTANGLAMFGKILSNKTDLKEYGNSIISALVKYLGANQGGLFFETKSDMGLRTMDLIACYAYERRKYLEAKVQAGEGLLGQCMLEKDFVFVTDVPQDYVKITSGLGEATPRNIIIAPLLQRDVFYGAIELGTFKTLQPYQLDFLKIICENIASEIAAIRSLDETRKLLNESEQLTSTLQTREEELKQNLEELAATQEEMARKQAEIDSYLAAINVTIASAEFDSHGRFARGNDIFLKVLGYRNDELESRKYSELMPEESSARMMWENLSLGKFFSGEFKMRDKNGNEMWLTGTFNPVTADGKIKKIMMLAQFITKEKEHLNELSEMANILKSSFPLAEFNEDFICKTANDRFMKMFRVSRLQLKGKSMFDFVEEGSLKSVALKDVLARGCMNNTLPFKINGRVVPFEVSISKTTSLDGKLTKFVLVLIKEVDQKMPALAAV